MSSVRNAMSTSFSLPIDQDILLRFPPTKYEYVKVHFVIKNLEPYPISEEEKDSYANILECYFIFQQNNWFIRNDVHRFSMYNSKDTYHKEFSDALYRKNVVDNLILALVTEQRKLMLLFGQEDKEKIYTPILDFAVAKYIKQTKPNLMDVDLDKLSQDVHKYLRYQYIMTSGDRSKLPLGDPPRIPSALLLVSLMRNFPGTSLENILSMDENIVQMIGIVDKQMEIAQFESSRMGEKCDMAVAAPGYRGSSAP